MKPGEVVVVNNYDPNERVMIECDTRFAYLLKEFHIYPGTITKVIRDPGTNFILVEAFINAEKFKPDHNAGLSACFDFGPGADEERVEIWCNKSIFALGDKGDKFLYNMNNGPITPEKLIGESNG